MIFWLVLAVLVATIFAVGAFLRAPFDVLLILCVAAFAVALASTSADRDETRVNRVRRFGRCGPNEW